MKKYLLSIIVLLIALFPLTFVNAKSIEQIIVYQDFKDIIVKGKTSDDVLAVNIEVYNDDETEFIKKLTAYVNDDNTFKTIIDVENGKYALKIADYDGGNYETVWFNKEDPSVDSAADSAAASVAETSDNITTYIIIGLVSIALLTGIILYKKKSN